MSTSQCVLIRGLISSAIAVSMMAIGIITSAQAQSAQLEAHVTAASGTAVLIKSSGGSSATSPIMRGQRLIPGDVIETRGNGRVILTLTDGSQVIIHPNSRVVIKDFRAAASARELIDVMVGYVRVKIYHTGKRPNPYRVNTPLATIAVRGTSFGVNVTITGETQVTVFEGLVEVINQMSPQQKRLLSPGRSVVVRPSGDIGLLAPGAGSDLNAIPNYPFFEPDLNGASSLRGDYLFKEPGTQISFVTQNYLDNISSAASNASFERFLAFADAHFDSQENPAYAAGFAKPDGRIYLVSSINAARRGGPLYDDIQRLKQVSYSSNSIAEQTSYFLPIKGTRVVLGGAFTLAYTHLRSDAGYNFLYERLLSNENSKLNLRTLNWSIIAARRFGGDERTSLGLQFDQSVGHVAGDTRSHSTRSERYAYDSRSSQHDQVKRSRVTVGMTRDFGEGRKLGVFYRYGIATSGINTVNLHELSILESYDSFVTFPRYRTQSSEIEARWRSPLSSRLYYGFHGSLLFDIEKASDKNPQARNVFRYRSSLFNIDYANTYIFEYPLIERSSRGAIIGSGVGYEIRRQTTIAFDIAGGVFNRTINYRRGDNHKPYFSERNSDGFLSLHAGGQTELGRRFFINGSLYWEKNWGLEGLFYHSRDHYFGRPFKFYDMKTVVNLGPGWRIRRNLSAQYILSWNDKNEIKSHSIMFRYDLGSANQ